MAMRTLTILQFLSVLAVYCGMTMLLPALVFHRKMQGESFGVKFIAYLTMGNFYLMNLVFVLQLLHISNRYTLILFTVGPAVWAAVKINRIPVKDGVLETTQQTRRFFEGTLGFKLLVSNVARFLRKTLGSAFRRLFRSLFRDFFDWVGTGLVIGLVLWQFGTNMVETYGYCASDIPVHNYWINALSNNNIFVAGVYPYGFHCMIYYMHAVFGIETFVLLRVFCLVQTLIVHLALLVFLRMVCRTRYMPYLAFALYTLGDFWNGGVVFWRYYSSLPQEFGMMFILPAALFLILFFPDRKKEQGAKGFRVHSTRYLVWFAMSFAMTLEAHFYNTMVIGLFCVGIAIGYLGLLFRKAFFGRILLAGILSVMVAVLPMGIAFATGTPLEGSLRWGMSVITGAQGSSDEEEAEKEEGADGKDGDAADDGTAGPETEDAGAGTKEAVIQIQAKAAGPQAGEAEPKTDAAETRTDAEDSGEAQPVEEEQLSFREWAENLLQGFYFTIYVTILSPVAPERVVWFLLPIPVIGVFGLLYLFPKRTRYYGSTLLSVMFFEIFMCIMLMAIWLDLPSLMDQGRCSIYLAYGLVMVMTLCADAAVSLVLGWIPKAFVMNGASLLGVASLSAVILLNGKCREPSVFKALETNGAIVCVTNILRENSPQTFTICSANDELRMTEEYGFHYETIDLLRGMEMREEIEEEETEEGDETVEKEELKEEIDEEEAEEEDGALTIPTPMVYFFIEKIPGDYMEPYEGSGRAVSEEGAEMALPRGSVLGVYKGENRYVVMSRMYYWAMAYQELYPAEMSVYYETDDFICYELKQNVYRLYDLAIDYGFNI